MESFSQPSTIPAAVPSWTATAVALGSHQTTAWVAVGPCPRPLGLNGATWAYVMPVMPAQALVPFSSQPKLAGQGAPMPAWACAVGPTAPTTSQPPAEFQQGPPLALQRPAAAAAATAFCPAPAAAAGVAPARSVAPWVAAPSGVQETEGGRGSSSSGSVRGQVWSLSQDAAGSRRVQRALEEAADDAERAALVEEMRGHVLEAMHCPHANHVLQKVVVSMRPQALDFIINEITSPEVSYVVQVARHKFGCRILQRLLEHCRREQLVEVVQELYKSAVALSKHAYANFVVQHLMEYGSEEQRGALARLLEQHTKALGKDDHGRAVLSAALTHTNSEQRVALARAIVQWQGLLVRMARTRQGHAAVRCVLEVLEGEERQDACRQLLDGIEKLRLSRYGRMVLSYLL